MTLRQTQGSPDAADPVTLVATGRSLVAVRDATFLLGPGIVPALNALLLAPILYRARLVPRILPLVGLVGAPLLLVSAMATLFSTNEQISGLHPPRAAHSRVGTLTRHLDDRQRVQPRNPGWLPPIRSRVDYAMSSQHSAGRSDQ